MAKFRLFSKAQQQISRYHNCKKDLKAASGPSLPCLSLFCKDGGGVWDATAVRASETSQKLAYDLDEGPHCFFFVCAPNCSSHEGSVNSTMGQSSFFRLWGSICARGCRSVPSPQPERRRKGGEEQSSLCP